MTRAADLPQPLRLVEEQVEAINRFPDQNPNPVMRMAPDGTLLYRNQASSPIVDAWGTTVGQRLPHAVRDALVEASTQGGGGAIEVNAGARIFSVLAIDVADLGFINLYGTDVTAAKLIDRFPGDNPNPVMRVTPDGRLMYTNRSSQRIVKALGLVIGDPLPAHLLDAIRAELAGHGASTEVDADGHIYLLTAVALPEFGFVNVYGTDVTARKAITKFPDQNPNPVLRVTRDGVLAYANPASALVQKALDTDVGASLPTEMFARISAAAERDDGGVIELSADGRVYEVLVIAVFEFDFINLYGTDVTAARMVERANAENERLLLNILPASIAERLRSGEGVIADRFDEMSVLFADVVDFTPLSARLTPDELINLLNVVFRRFDELAQTYRLEKIKTVGDAYMVAGGISGDGADHPARVADMGLAMLESMPQLTAQVGESLQIRVGMHVGPGIAGVIGIRKFIYDVWGDTVNTASRMESHGVPGRIQVTDATAKRLEDRYLFEPRGIVEVKGKGPTATSLLLGRRNGSRPAGS